MGRTQLLRQPVAAWLRLIGRLKPGATTDGMGAGLRQFSASGSRPTGYPPNWMADITAVAAPGDRRRPCGAGVGVMKEQTGGASRSARRVRSRAAHRVRERGEPAAGKRGRSSHTNRSPLAMGASRLQIVTQALVESVCSRFGRGRRTVWRPPRRGYCSRSRSAASVPADRHDALAAGPRLRVPLALVTGIVFGAAPAWFATRTDPVEALRGAGRSTGDTRRRRGRALLVVQATLSVVLVAGAIMLARSLNNLERQDFGYQVTAGRRGP